MQGARFVMFASHMRANTTQQETSRNPGHTPPVTLTKWCRDVGVHPVTVWKWRKRGWLDTINICGKQYVTAEAADRFTRRAASGEFSKPAHTDKATRARTAPLRGGL